MYTQFSSALGGDGRSFKRMVPHRRLKNKSHNGNVLSWFVTVAMSALLFVMLMMLAMVPAHAKTPGSTYCFYKKCHRVKTISETSALVGRTLTLHASHYSDCSKDRYNPCGLTSSGERFYPGRPDNAASPIYPDGTILLIWNQATGGAAVVRINNAGPYWGNRKLDVSISTAKKLGFAHSGVAKLRTMILSAPTKSEARYSRHRNYKKVHGYLGKFESLEQAHRSSIAISAIEALAGSTTAPATGGIVAASRYETSQDQKQRQRIAKKAKQITLAMRAPVSRWPDFAVSLKTPDTHLTPVLAEEITIAKALSVPKSIGAIETIAQLGPTPTQQLILRRRPGSATKPSLAAGEWVALAKPAIVLVHATDAAGVSDHHEWLGRGRLGFTFQISSNAHIERLSSRQTQRSSRKVAMNMLPRNRVPIPNHRLPYENKVARAVGKLT